LCSYDLVYHIITSYKIDYVIHFAAQSHVQNSFEDALQYTKDNIVGTHNLLEAVRKYGKIKKFIHVSTDEVYGSLHDGGFFLESTPYDPQSPYSASKASSDHFIRAYHNTYKIPVVLSNCSNNYGPNQFPEKLIPLFINNIRNNKPLPVYGKGENIRDWLFVEDHAVAIDVIFHFGKNGETYNIGGHNEWKNIDLIHTLCDIMDKKLGREPGTSRKLITFVKDRAGHDLRYAIDSSKLQRELGWTPSLQFEEGLEKTVDWYLNNQSWMDEITSGEYKSYYEKQYQLR
jgi:dTDP-glucose 4,6-dehydratase